MDALRRNKTTLLDILSHDTALIFNKIDALGLVTRREYRNLTTDNKENAEGQLRNFLDLFQAKSPECCSAFLHALRTDADLLLTFPRLEEIQWNDSKTPSRKRGASPASLDGPVHSRKKEEDVTDTTDVDDQYMLTSTPVGLCLIINNKEFEQHGRRDGTDNDAAQLARTWGRLGFSVLMCEDQTKDQMEKTLSAVSSLKDLGQLKGSNVKEWSDSGLADLNHLPRHGDAFVCCILTHGDSQGVCGTDGERVPTRDVIAPFSSSSCPSLHTKPKLFFIQACRGGQNQRAVPVLHTDGDWENLAERTSYSLPEYADFLIGFSTIDQHASARERDGSWYVQMLCQRLEDGCNRRHDILRILTGVTDAVCRLEGKLRGVTFKQSPDSMNTLRRQLHFRRI